MQSSDEFMVHARHMDRRWARTLQYQQTKNQELQKNMVALASQMKGLEEEAMKKLKVRQPYPPSLPPPETATRTQSASGEEPISAGASPKAAGKDESEDKVAVQKQSSDVSMGAVKMDSYVNYGKSN